MFRRKKPDVSDSSAGTEDASSPKLKKRPTLEGFDGQDTKLPAALKASKQPTVVRVHWADDQSYKSAILNESIETCGELVELVLPKWGYDAEPASYRIQTTSASGFLTVFDPFESTNGLVSRNVAKVSIVPIWSLIEPLIPRQDKWFGLGMSESECKRAVKDGGEGSFLVWKKNSSTLYILMNARGHPTKLAIKVSADYYSIGSLRYETLALAVHALSSTEFKASNGAAVALTEPAPGGRWWDEPKHANVDHKRTARRTPVVPNETAVLTTPPHSPLPTHKRSSFKAVQMDDGYEFIEDNDFDFGETISEANEFVPDDDTASNLKVGTVVLADTDPTYEERLPSEKFGKTGPGRFGYEDPAELALEEALASDSPGNVYEQLATDRSDPTAPPIAPPRRNVSSEGSGLEFSSNTDESAYEQPRILFDNLSSFSSFSSTDETLPRNHHKFPAEKFDTGPSANPRYNVSPNSAILSNAHLLKSISLSPKTLRKANKPPPPSIDSPAVETSMSALKISTNGKSLLPRDKAKGSVPVPLPGPVPVPRSSSDAPFPTSSGSPPLARPCIQQHNSDEDAHSVGNRGTSLQLSHISKLGVARKMSDGAASYLENPDEQVYEYASSDTLSRSPSEQSVDAGDMLSDDMIRNALVGVHRMAKKGKKNKPHPDPIQLPSTVVEERSLALENQPIDGQIGSELPQMPKNVLDDQFTDIAQDWRQINSNDGKIYYYNTKTRKTSWTLPFD